ncbi:MAG: aminotransferase class V-fold PLP-dependent enzyme [Clostridia bacterium]|nr:aminotransferase class V-fold PLP-dependent enzyme [Clostridia bacterium]
MERIPLYQRLKEHEKLDRSSFHTPGHKCSGFFDAGLIRLDYTELPDTDALYEAEGVILEAERILSVLFNTKCSLISAGGCSLAIQAMLRIALDRGKKILCARNAHRSAVNAIALLGFEPVWIAPRGETGFTGRIIAEEVERKFRENPDITACYITSPSYYGQISDISAIAGICRQYGALLLVDNAHGSHLAFMKENLHPIHLGADITACSLHKTLPVMTGGAALNIGNGELADNAKSAMSLFGSTSPSYVIMSSVDLCVDYMLFGGGKDEYRKCEERVALLKQLAAEKGIKQPSGLCDPLRLTLDTASVGLCGEEQLSYFEENGIDCEFCDGENAVLLCTPFNSERDFRRIEAAVQNMPVSSAKKQYSFHFKEPEKAMSVRRAMLAPSETLPLSGLCGRVAADTSCPCPPGVPPVMPGEVIDENVIAVLKQYGEKKFKVVK